MTVEMVKGTFDLHIALLPAGRGRIGVQAGKAVLTHLFQVLDAECVRAFVPADNRACIWETAATGMHYRHRLHKGGCESLMYGLTRSEWVLE